MNTKKAIVGIVAGVAVGVVLGVLFAPEKGSRIRKGIARKGEDLADALCDKVEDRLDDLVESMSGRIRKANIKSKTGSVESASTQ
jgi:gas vesicle protein